MMISQSKAKIFLSEERGHTELDWHRTYSTFNYGNFYNPHKQPFGLLQVLNEETLAAGHRLFPRITADACVIIIPLIGSVVCNNNGSTLTVQAGEALRCCVKKNTALELANPYKEDTISFIQLWIKDVDNCHPAKSYTEAFDLETCHNYLIPLFKNFTGRRKATIALGKFNGRADGCYNAGSAGAGTFVFVLEGAFEVQNRLLHARDGLALWEAGRVEFEALSGNAIILFIECSS